MHVGEKIARETHLFLICGVLERGFSLSFFFVSWVGNATRGSGEKIVPCDMILILSLQGRYSGFDYPSCGLTPRGGSKGPFTAGAVARVGSVHGKRVHPVIISA